MTNSQKFVQIPLAWLKKPIGLIAIGIIGATGGNIGMNKIMGSPSEQAAQIQSMRQELSDLKQENAVRDVKLQGLSEQLNRMETKQDRLEAKLDRLMERMSFRSGSQH